MTETNAAYGAAHCEAKAVATALLEAVTPELRSELTMAFSRHPEGYGGGHEAYGLMREELDEYFDLVKRDCAVSLAKETEALHIAVTALRTWKMHRDGRKACIPNIAADAASR